MIYADNEKVEARLVTSKEVITPVIGQIDLELASDWLIKVTFQMLEN